MPEDLHSDVDPDAARWLAAASFLDPQKSIERLVANAKYIAASVTVVAAVLTVAGSLSAGGILQSTVTRVSASISAILASAAIVLAYLPFVLRTRRVNVENLEEVRAWYDVQFRLGKFVTAAGASLIGALLAALLTAAVIAFTPDAGSLDAAMTLSGSGEGRTLTVVVAITPPPGITQLDVAVTGLGPRQRISLLSTNFRAIDGVPLTFRRQIYVPSSYSCFELRATYSGRSSHVFLRCGR